MSPGQVFKFLLFLGLISLVLSRPLSAADKKLLQSQQARWKSPKIHKFLEGNVSKKGKLYTYKFKYKNTEENKICDVVYKEKRLDNRKVESEHEWKCKLPPNKEDGDSNLTGEDYS